MSAKAAENQAAGAPESLQGGSSEVIIWLNVGAGGNVRRLHVHLSTRFNCVFIRGGSGGCWRSCLLNCIEKEPAGQSSSFSKKRHFLCTETWCEVFNQSRLTPSTEQAICWWFDNFRHFWGGGCNATKTWDLAVQPGGVCFPKCPPEGSRDGSDL